MSERPPTKDVLSPMTTTTNVIQTQRYLATDALEGNGMAMVKKLKDASGLAEKNVRRGWHTILYAHTPTAYHKDAPTNLKERQC